MNMNLYSESHKEFNPLKYQDRLRLLTKLKEVIQSSKNQILSALYKDLGKSEFEATTSEVSFVIEEIDFALDHLKEWCELKKIKTPLKLKPANSYIKFEPYGKVLIMASWNYPFQLLISPLVGAIAAGNRVVLKPSEVSQNTENVLKELIKKNFDSKEIDIQTGGPDFTQKLLQQKWDFIFFTGSTQVGRIVMKAAAENLTPVCLELGGKSPCVIEEDADIQVAAKRITWAKFFNAGQTCVAPDYLLVHEKVYDEFLRELKKNITHFYGDYSKSTDYCKIITSKHLSRLEALLANTEVLHGGKVDLGTCKMEPTLVSTSFEHPIMKEEIFGPILPIFKFQSSEIAIEQIKKFPKPLSAYFYTQSQILIEKYVSQISFGGGCVNDCILHLANPYLPFGGVGPSGTGAYHGQYSFEVFSHKKSILEKSTSFDPDFRYPPYTDKLKTWVKYFLK